MVLGYFSVFLLITPLHGYRNWTFNPNIIPRNMKEFQEQTKDSYTKPVSQQELETMLARTDHVMPNFDVDGINETSQRFEKIKALYEMKKDEIGAKNEIEIEPQKNILRQATKKEKELDEKTVKRNRINRRALQRAFALMTQFVYAARYKLTYGQMLRAHYRTVIEYRIGYLFALMRDLRLQQMILYSTMHYNYRLYYLQRFQTHFQIHNADYVAYFQIYEKIVNIDVNIKDIVKLAKTFMEWRLKNEVVSTVSKDIGDYGYEDDDK